MKMTSPVSLSIWIQVPVMTVILSPLNGLKSGASSSKTSDPVSHYANVLESFASEHGLRVHDVPRDGNCLFSSGAYQLQNMGHDVNLRQMVVSYFQKMVMFTVRLCISQ